MMHFYCCTVISLHHLKNCPSACRISQIFFSTSFLDRSVNLSLHIFNIIPYSELFERYKRFPKKAKYKYGASFLLSFQFPVFTGSSFTVPYLELLLKLTLNFHNI